MKKTLFTLILCGCLLLCGAALSEATLPVTLGDGAPIPYFDGYTSDSVTDPALLQGVTGAATGSMYIDLEQGGMTSIYEIVNRTLHMQNIAATDDYLALFFTLAFDRDIPFPEGRTQYSINRAIGFIEPFQGDAFLAMDTVVEEARLLDAKTLACMVVFSLDAPLDPTKTLDIASGWGEDGNPVYGLRYQLDTQGRVDTTAVSAPMIEVSTIPHEGSESRHASEITRIERIAQTPFGTRVCLNQQDVGAFALFGYGFADGEGNLLPQCSGNWRSHSDASPEHPYWIRNDIWLLHDAPLDKLQLLPVAWQENTPEKEAAFADNQRTAFVPMDAMPTSVTLENGHTLHMEQLTLEPDGFLIAYRPVKGKAELMHFTLADAAGNQLDYNYVSYDAQSIAKQLLYCGGFWSEAYKDRTVPRVTEAEISAISGILINYQANEPQYVLEDAIILDL